MSDTKAVPRLSADLGFPDVVRSYVGGEWVVGEGEENLDVVNPATEERLATVRASSADQVEAAVRAARSSFDRGSWRLASASTRSKMLHRLVDVLASNQDLLERQIVAEVGMPRSLAKPLQVGDALKCLDWFADAAARGPRGGFEHGLPLQSEPAMAASLVRREAVGVVAAITAYNYPLLLLARKIGGALASGCSTVVLPSPRAPLTTATFFELAQQIDLPPGVINLVLGGQSVGKQLTTNPDIDMISFTGSVAVGRQVMAQAAGGITRVVLELGGKSPTVILPGADLEKAIGPSIKRFIINAGQGCGATTRTLVPRQVHDEYVDRAKAFMKGVVVGDPTDPSTDVGPLIRAEHRQHVQGYIDRALEHGAATLVEGAHEESSGFFMAPRLLGNLQNSDEIAQQELFGPVGVLLPYGTVEEAISIANATQFRLNANVWGPTPAAMMVARELRSGTVSINGGGAMRHDVHWGGGGLSGLGLEGGEDGFLEFFDAKHIQWPL